MNMSNRYKPKLESKQRLPSTDIHVKCQFPKCIIISKDITKAFINSSKWFNGISDLLVLFNVSEFFMSTDGWSNSNTPVLCRRVQVITRLPGMRIIRVAYRKTNLSKFPRCHGNRCACPMNNCKTSCLIY